MARATRQPNRNNAWKAAFLVSLVFLLGCQFGGMRTISMSVLSTVESSMDDVASLPTSSFLLTSTTQSSSETTTKSKARRIIERSYQETYAHLDTFCQNHTNFKACIRQFYAQTKDNNNNINRQNSNFPWWFHTMLRDGSANFLHAQWHNRTIKPHKIHVCAIEKVGSSEWKVIARGESLSGSVLPQVQDRDWHRIVVLRDPLTRFLSAFINKCISMCTRHSPCRVHEKHCEPETLFAMMKKDNNNKNGVGNDNLTKPHRDEMLLDDFLNNPQLFFEAYLDLIPLKWNVHFFPQALYCDGLYRHIDTYNFVGTMGPHFQQDILRLGGMYGEPLNTTLVEKFKINTTTTVVFDQNYNTTPTAAFRKAYYGQRNQQASRQILEYYNARTVRKALQYFSIDYLRLDLPIPEWVDEMLAREDEDGVD